MKIKKHSVMVLPLVLSAVYANTALGAGFQLLEQNASGLGNAYAGSGVDTENASVLHFNPAAMTYLPGIHVTGGVTAIRPSFKFTDNGQSVTPFNTKGTSGGDAGGWGVVPNLAATWQLNPRWYVGLGVGVPFGLKTEYEDDWVGRFHSREFEIKTININPTIAYRVNDQWSIGAGVNWQRIDAKYKLAVPVVHPLLPFPVEGDAKVDVNGDAWGWNVGVVFQPVESTRIGLSYRSRIKHTGKGDTNIAVQGQHMVAADARATVKLPDTAILSVSHQLNPRWTLLGDVSWTGWSSIPELTIENQGLPSNALDLQFRDTWRFALGAKYKINEDWTWKVGVATDQAPIRSAEKRPTSLPDNNRRWYSTGVQYQHKNMSFDVGYTYLYLKKTPIHNLEPGRGLVSGEYKSKGHVIGMQVSASF